MKKVFIIISIIATLLAIFFINKAYKEKLARQNVRAGWNIIRPPHEVSALVIHGDQVWAGGKDGLYLTDRKNPSSARKIEAGFPLTYIKALLVDRGGLLWIGYERGLATYDGKNFLEIRGLPDKRVNALMEDSKGRIWAGTWGGVAVREDGLWRVTKKSDGLLDDMVNVVLEDKAGGMWFGSYVAPAGGVSILKDGKWQHFSVQNGLPHNNVSMIFQDRQGLVWLGTGLLDRGGAVGLKFNQGSWVIDKRLTKADGLAGDKVRSIFQDRDGAMWFGSEYDGVVRFNNASRTVFTGKNGLSDPEVKVMAQDVDGNIWLATKDGLTYINQESLKALP